MFSPYLVPEVISAGAACFGCAVSTKEAVFSLVIGEFSEILRTGVKL